MFFYVYTIHLNFFFYNITGSTKSDKNYFQKMQFGSIILFHFERQTLYSNCIF